MKYRLLPQQCKECKYQFACHGECPKNRFIRDCYGNPGLNYLCKGYYQFFNHVAPYMDFMKNELENQRPPANVMNQVFGKSARFEFTPYTDLILFPFVPINGKDYKRKQLR